MIVGVPKEIKAEEKRVAITPNGVAALSQHRHRVLVERGAGLGSGISDATFREAGARIVSTRDVWRRAETILKVKEPLPAEFPYLRPGLIVFTYLHLASSARLTRELLRRRVTAIGYETIQLDDGSLPLLAPMSEIAGRLSIQVGAWCLEAQNGGSGVLLSGASGVRPGKVVVLGAGIAGANACRMAAAIGAHVNIEEEVRSADLVVGSVLIAGAKAPRLVSRKLVRSMRPGSAIVDISIDQGGCVETSRPTTHHHPIYVAEGVVHYAVTNMPAIVPHTSTFALTNSTFEYALALADKGLPRALADDSALKRGVNAHAGHVTHRAVAEAFGLEHVGIEELVSP